MRKDVVYIALAAGVVLLVLVAMSAVRFSHLRPPLQNSSLNLNTNQATASEGLVVALNQVTEKPSTSVQVNYVDVAGETVRTRQIPNAKVDSALFQVVEDDVFVYTKEGDEPGLRRMNQEGSMSGAAGIHQKQSGSFFWLVAPDESQMAWSDNGSIYISKVNGSDRQQVGFMEGSPEVYPRFFTWVKGAEGEWTPWYTQESIRIGGYILFEDALGPVLSPAGVVAEPPYFYTDVSPDGSEIVAVEHTEHNLVIHAGNQTHVLTDAGQAGEATLSPSGQYVAIAEAAGNPEAELGWVDIWNRQTDALVRVNTQAAGDVFHVVGWLDADTVVLQVPDVTDLTASTVYVVKADGSFFRKIWNGYAIGVVAV